MNSAVPNVNKTTFDVARIRNDFPIFQDQMNGKPLVYLDNAASTQKPQVMIDAEQDFYAHKYANIHRGVYKLSEQATIAFEATRKKVQLFLNANDVREIIFTRSTTESINLVAQSFGRQVIQPGDEVLITEMEHHSNIVPWQLVCEERGANLKVVSMNDAGEVDLADFERLITDKTRIVAVTHVSNALGTVNPVKEIVAVAHRRKVPVLLDGAQAAPHLAIDVQDLDCDFYAFSGHKVFGPTGVGVLYGKYDLLDAMPPYEGGGDMIQSVTFAKTTFQKPPYKFEAGTPNIAAVIALGVSLDYVNAIGLDVIASYEQELHDFAVEQIQKIPGVRLIGTAAHKTGLVSFVMDGAHPHDVGTILDQEGIAIRAGHHCAQPVMEHYKIPATVRASFAFYNTYEEINALIKGLEKVREIFG